MNHGRYVKVGPLVIIHFTVVVLIVLIFAILVVQQEKLSRISEALLFLIANSVRALYTKLRGVPPDTKKSDVSSPEEGLWNQKASGKLEYLARRMKRIE